MRSIDWAPSQSETQVYIMVIKSTSFLRSQLHAKPMQARSGLRVASCRLPDKPGQFPISAGKDFGNRGGATCAHPPRFPVMANRVHYRESGPAPIPGHDSGNFNEARALSERPCGLRTTEGAEPPIPIPVPIP
jgi:hypothetical protein